MSQENPGSPPEPEENVNAEAIRQARKRVQERERLAEYDRTHRPRPEWDRAPDSYEDVVWGGGDGWDRNGRWGWGWGGRDTAALYLFLAIFAVGSIVSFLAWMWENARWPAYQVMVGLDTAVGARALTYAPFLIWAFWGGVFGGALGYWLIAPVYGDRDNRVMVLILPVFIMIVCAFLSWGIFH